MHTELYGNYYNSYMAITITVIWQLL